MTNPVSIRGGEQPEHNTRLLKAVVTLVHGTWGQGLFPTHPPFLSSKTRWYEEGSPFREALRDCLREQHIAVHFEQFLWSGANSIASREAAATELHQSLIAQTTLHTNSYLVVIGHSHGGDVAVRAAAKFGSISDRILVVTLATPFLWFRPSSYVDPESRVLKYLRAFLAVLGVVVLFAFMALAGPMFNSVAGALFVLSLSFVIVSAWERLAIHIVGGRFDTLIRILWPDRRLRLSVLALRSPRDEATIALKLGAIGSSISNYTIWFYGWLFHHIWPLLLLPVAIWFLVVFLNFLSDEIGKAAFLLFLMLGASLFLLSPAVMFVSFFLAATCNCVNGRELFFGGFMFNVEVKDLPDSLGKIDRIVLPPMKLGTLRHSLYNHEECPPAAAAYIANFVFRAGANQPHNMAP